MTEYERRPPADLFLEWCVPSGRVHNLINLAGYAALGGAAWSARQAGLLSFDAAQALCFSVGFAVGTFLLSPDLDLAEGHVSSKRAWGPLGALWVPYGMLFSHRGLSHSWIVGPLTRLAYLAVLAALGWGLLHALAPGLRWPAPAAPPWALAWPLLAGYYLSQWLHLIADGIRPDRKLTWKRR